MSTAVAKTRTGGEKGIWSEDRTTKGFAVSNLSSVTETSVILPKLFRRIVSFMEGGGSIEGFKEFLAANPDQVMELNTGHFTNLDTFVEVRGHEVKLTVEPEQLVFIE